MKMLICHDGSRQAENAVRFSARIASACGAEVTLLGIIEQPGVEADLQDALRRGEQWLRENQLAVQVVIRPGKPVGEILQQTRQSSYDLVVIGAVRKATKGAFWMSAKAYKLIKELTLPVLVVIGSPEDLKRILLCSGGTSYVNKAVAFTVQLARALAAQVTLVHVFAQPPAFYANLIARLEDVEALLNSRSSLGRNLRQQKQLLEQAGVSMDVKLRHGPVVWELLDEIHRGQYDLVVTGFAAKPGPLRTFMMGDVTRELINRADRPLLIVHSQPRPEAPAGIPGLVARLREIFTSVPAEAQNGGSNTKQTSKNST